MEEIKTKREYMRKFWDENYTLNRHIRSVKQVFANYKAWCVAENVPVINEYVFRTYIRKVQEKKKRYQPQWYDQDGNLIKEV